jgi:cell division protein FtsB
MKKKSFLKISLYAVLLLGLVIAWLGFGERGFIHLYRMEKQRQASLERIRLLEKANEELMNQIDRLRTDETHIEREARRDLGLVRDGEIIYRFSDDSGRKEPVEKVRKKIRGYGERDSSRH